MAHADEALSIITEAEGRLRKLVAEAAAAGDYEGVVKIASWAKQLTGIAGSAEKRRLPTPLQDGIPSLGMAKARPVTALPRARTSEAYPRFYRNADRLIRVAWSKEKKAEYEHKAPKSVLTGLGSAVVEAGADGRVFSMDDILPLHGEDGSEVPHYQVYVALALLKQLGFIDQHGRQGYSIARPDDLLDAIESVWRNLRVE